MWASQAQPGWSVSRAQRRSGKQSIDASAFSNSEAAFQHNAPIPQHYTTPAALNLTDLLEPAVDGPPSPGRLRALSNQVKKSFINADRHHSHHATASSSSLLSSNSVDRRPSWEQTLETLTLSRKSSTRSNSSSMPSRDRPESVQTFGKAIFNRSRVKLKRDSTATGSSGESSLYSSDVAPDVVAEPRSRAGSVTKDQFMQGIFSWRRPTIPAVEDVSTQRRLQISSPFNFQHVTHNQRDHQLVNRDEAMAAEQYRRASEARRTSLHKSPPTFSIKHTRSQDQLKMAPPRPPRSPPRSPKNMDFGSHAPPPRFSSRTSVPYDEVDPLTSTTVERPYVMGGFRRPAPLPLQVDTTSPPPTSYGNISPTDISERRHSRIFFPSTTDNPNWPLPCPPANSSTFDFALPDVPEEEEHHGLPRRSRASFRSIRSTNSSLRGSQSVPALRHVAKHSTSDETVILDSFDMFTAQTAIIESELCEDDVEPLSRDSWEDVIDYCYEHEAEADCDYEWGRSSLEMAREDALLEASNSGLLARPTSDRFDVPALSPASHLSVGSVHEAITPTMLATATKSPTSSNFSLPRRDGRPHQQSGLLHMRSASQASSFKESHGFNLSPSKLIPNDYHQELLAYQATQLDHDGLAVAAPYEEPIYTMETSQLFAQSGSRSSASTMASASVRSVFGDRHISTASTNTDYTRLTMSSASVNMDDLLHLKNDEPIPSFEDPVMPAAISEKMPASHSRSKSLAGLMLAPRPEDIAGPMLSCDDSHSSDPNLVKLHSAKRQVGRGRASTTSLSTPPPLGQYALFPNVAVTGTRI